jgi:hypothetical protein
MATVTKTIGSAGGRDYSTITAWEADLGGGSYADGDSAVGECYNDSTFDESFTIDDGSFTKVDSIKLKAADGQEHDGTPDSGVKITYSGSIGNASAVWKVGYTSETHGNKKVKIEGLEFADISNSQDIFMYSFNLGTLNTIFSRCLVNNIKTSNSSTKDFHVFHNGQSSINNTMIFNCGKTSTSNSVNGTSVGLRLDDTTNNKIYNCTVHNIFDNTPSAESQGAVYGEYRNTIITNANKCYKLVSGSSNSNNISSDSTAPGDYSLTNKDPEDIFVSTTQGSEDLHVKSRAPGLRKGVDLGTTDDVQYDIDNFDRDSTGSIWDIGADQCNSCTPDIGKTPNSKLSLGFMISQELSGFGLADF